MSEKNAVEEIMNEFLVEKQDRKALEELLLKFDKEDGYKIDSSLIDFRINELDKKMGEQLDLILHHPKFQELESIWRGLEYVVQNTSFESDPVVLELLNLSKEDLMDDFDVDDVKHLSKLWERVYYKAYDLAKGHPYTFMMGNFEFDRGADDIELLTNLSVLGEMCQLPFLSSAGPDMFGLKTYDEVSEMKQIEDIVNDDPKQGDWLDLREDDRAKYLGLALPGFLGRSPYHSEGRKIKSFAYDESFVDETTDNSLWVNAGWGLVANLLKSYEENGWSVKIVGEEGGGKVDGLPSATFVRHGSVKKKTPFQTVFGLEKDQELTNMGFMPITYYDGTNYGVFHEAASARLVENIDDDPIQTQTNKVAAGLQYTMLVSRIGHYMKQRHLRFVGKNASKGKLQEDLESWLNQYVADMPNPSESLVAERPLRSYVLTVEDSDQPGFFLVNLELRPHVAVIGADVRLKLVAFHEAKEG